MLVDPSALETYCLDLGDYALAFVTVILGFFVSGALFCVHVVLLALDISTLDSLRILGARLPLLVSLRPWQAFTATYSDWISLPRMNKWRACWSAHHPSLLWL